MPSKWVSFQSAATKVFKGLAHLLVDEVYRQLRDKAESAEAQQT